jgi:hypothetical protein
MAHPGAFPAWPLTQIFDCILISLVTGNILVCAEDGAITGVMLFHTENKIFHISQLVVSSKTALTRFIGYYKLRYATYSITGLRRQKLKTYKNLERVFTLLQKVR